MIERTIALAIAILTIYQMFLTNKKIKLEIEKLRLENKNLKGDG